MLSDLLTLVCKWESWQWLGPVTKCPASAGQGSQRVFLSEPDDLAAAASNVRFADVVVVPVAAVSVVVGLVVVGLGVVLVVVAVNCNYLEIAWTGIQRLRFLLLDSAEIDDIEQQRFLRCSDVVAAVVVAVQFVVAVVVPVALGAAPVVEDVVVAG